MAAGKKHVTVEKKHEIWKDVPAAHLFGKAQPGDLGDNGRDKKSGEEQQ